MVHKLIFLSVFVVYGYPFISFKQHP